MNDNDKIRITEEISNNLFQMFQRHENIANMTEDVGFIMQCAFDKKKSVWEYCSGHLYVLALTYIIHSGFISGYQNRYGDNLKPPTNVYHRMTA